MNAKEMFEELGFVLFENSEKIGIIEYHKEISFGNFTTRRVHFDLKAKLYYVYHAKGNEFGDFEESEVMIDLHQAITQQMKELGWIK